MGRGISGWVVVLLVGLSSGCGSGSSESGEAPPPPPPEPPRFTVAITVDDFPGHWFSSMEFGEISKSFEDALQGSGIGGATFFVVGDALDTEEEQSIVVSWHDRGFFIGNHTFTHCNLNETAFSEYNDEILATEDWLYSVLGASRYNAVPRYFRFPYHAEGATYESFHGVRDLLVAEGITHVPVTIDFHDYVFNHVYEHCIDISNPASVEALADEYVAAALVQLHYSSQLSALYFDREISHTLDLHMNPFTARMLPRLIEAYEAEGVGFVSVDKVMEDPALKFPVEVYTEEENTFLQRVSRFNGDVVYNEFLAQSDALALARCPTPTGMVAVRTPYGVRLFSVAR